MPTPAVKTDSPFWKLPVKVLLELVAASPDGLSTAEAAARLAQFGPNLIHGERKRALVLQFLTKFRNPLVIILLTASALSAFTGDAASFFIIGTIVIISVTLDFVQEYRAGQAAAMVAASAVAIWVAASAVAAAASAVAIWVAASAVAVAASAASMGEGSATLAVSWDTREATTNRANGFTTLVISGATSTGSAMVTPATTTRPTTHTTARRRITGGDLACKLTMSAKIRNGLCSNAAEPVATSR